MRLRRLIRLVWLGSCGIEVCFDLRVLVAYVGWCIWMGWGAYGDGGCFSIFYFLFSFTSLQISPLGAFPLYRLPKISWSIVKLVVSIELHAVQPRFSMNGGTMRLDAVYSLFIILYKSDMCPEKHQYWKRTKTQIPISAPFVFLNT